MAHELEVPPSWRWRRLSDVATVILSNLDKKLAPEEHQVRLCNYTDVYYHRYIDSSVPLSQGSASDRELRRFQVRKGDVLITKDSEDRHDIAVPALVTEDLSHVLCGYHLAIVRPRNADLDGGFLSVLLQCHRTRHIFSRLANGVTRFGLTLPSIEGARVPLPPIETQREISRIVLSVDRLLACVESMVHHKVRQRRALMQQLLTGRRRFPQYSEPWKTLTIGSVLTNVARYVDVDDNTSYRLISIRRRSGGLFDRGVKKGEEIGYDRLKAVKCGDFVIARRQVVHGAMAMAKTTSNGAYVSDSYATLVPRHAGSVNIRFFDYLSQTPEMYYRAYRCSYGVAIEKMFFNLNWFLAERVLLPPSVDEQGRIAATLAAADREIDLLRRELELLRKQRCGLIQKLMTGQIRVKAGGA